MVQRVREARFDNPTASQEDWMEESLDETGNNVAMSAFTDFIGFMVLALSIMPLFVTFGINYGSNDFLVICCSSYHASCASLSIW